MIHRVSSSFAVLRFYYSNAVFNENRERRFKTTWMPKLVEGFETNKKKTPNTLHSKGSTWVKRSPFNVRMRWEDWSNPALYPWSIQTDLASLKGRAPGEEVGDAWRACVGVIERYPKTKVFP